MTAVLHDLGPLSFHQRGWKKFFLFNNRLLFYNDFKSDIVYNKTISFPERFKIAI